MSILRTVFKSEEQIRVQNDKIAALESRVAFLEERLLSYYKNRWDVIDKLADYLVGAQIAGDYMEFGVYMGKTFSYAYRTMAPLFQNMRFVAVDSFEGLPEPKGIDAEGNYTSGFTAGQFACDIRQFEMNLESNGVDMKRVSMIKGWFGQTLRPDNPESAAMKQVAAAWIDCDLYESTVPVLDFVTSRLSVGSVILFDDWRCYRNLAEFGQQRACHEWLDRNPQIKLNDFLDFGFHGQAFTVASC
jgi:O-methyltransferase